MQCNANNAIKHSKSLYSIVVYSPRFTRPIPDLRVGRLDMRVGNGVTSLSSPNISLSWLVNNLGLDFLLFTHFSILFKYLGRGLFITRGSHFGPKGLVSLF